MQKLIYILLIISCSMLVYFILFLIGTHVSISLKNNKKNKIRKDLKSAIDEDDYTIFNSSKFRNTLSIDVISEEFENFDETTKKKLIDLLNKSDYKKYIFKVIKLKKVNEDTIFYIKFAGDLNITSLSHKLISLVKKYHDDIDLQYYCLDALAKFGDEENFLAALNLGFTIKLTSRALQEIFADYTGDYKKIFKELLNSKDPYIVRIVILMIGDLKITDLVPKLVKYVDSDDMNISISAIKVLSRMKYLKAYDKIVQKCDSDVWQVRSVALKYAAKLDVDASLPVLEKYLQDPEWWVRFNAARGIAKSKKRDSILKKLEKNYDTHAYDMLKYAIDDYKLNGGE